MYSPDFSRRILAGCQSHLWLQRNDNLPIDTLLMLIKAALNGGRSRAEHPAIPITPTELAASAKESIAAGAGAIHFHVRGADGRESLEPEDVAEALNAIRAAVPGTPIGVSTGAWILRDAQLRHEAVSRWKVLPDFASVNFGEDGALPLAELLLCRGIGVEVGLSDIAGTQVFVASGVQLSHRQVIAEIMLSEADVFLPTGIGSRCLRVLLELFEPCAQAGLKTLEQIEGLLDAAGVDLPRVLHGVNQTAWDLIDAAAARGYGTRVGFEDILTLPDGKQAPGNAALVSEAYRRMSEPRSL
jgi:uncharacterized protein (DUF849 family)